MTKGVGVNQEPFLLTSFHPPLGATPPSIPEDGKRKISAISPPGNGQQPLGTAGRPPLDLGLGVPVMSPAPDASLAMPGADDEEAPWKRQRRARRDQRGQQKQGGDGA